MVTMLRTANIQRRPPQEATQIAKFMALREAVPNHVGPLSGPLFKQWNLLLSFV